MYAHFLNNHKNKTILSGWSWCKAWPNRLIDYWWSLYLTTFCKTFVKQLSVSKHSQLFCYSYDVTVDPFGHWGNLLRNGTFSGAIGTLARRETDMSLSGYTYTYYRSKVSLNFVIIVINLSLSLRLFKEW